MKKRKSILYLFPESYTPRWIIFLLDIFIVLISITAAYFIRFNFEFPESEQLNTKLGFIIPYVLLIRSVTFIGFRSYAGIIRYTSAKDTERIFIVTLTGSSIFAVLNLVSFYFINSQYLIPFSVIIIDFLATIFLMTSARFMIKTIYNELYAPARHKTNVIIFGAGEFGTIAKRTLDRDAGTMHKVIGFLEDDNSKIGKILENVTIHSLDDLNSLLKKYEVEKLIISRKDIDVNTKSYLVDTCLEHDVKVLTVPEVNEWINGELSFNQIKKIRIEDLLEREPIILDEKQIKKQILNQVVLVTGAAGSIGSEIVRQLINYNPKKILLYDHAETPLYDIELSLKEKLNFNNYDIIVGSITDQNRLNFVFEKFHPSIVYHAAAYKHVPMMESNPYEAIRTNVVGTRMLAETANNYNVDNFVMISTDKAVNPTNVMGASKRIAEMFIQSFNELSKTKFVTTRFGNVLGSNGSVILRFKKQIDEGGPVTVTHPEVTRYFMTIPEACQLVLEAGAMNKAGEIFLFDMGESVKIIDLAKKIIKLSGLEIDKDIQIRYTGLRPGEKLYEELLNDQENTIPTYHSKIMIAKVGQCDYEKIKDQINQLSQILKSDNDEELCVKKMKEIVPEFLSNNSDYKKIDK